MLSIVSSNKSTSEIEAVSFVRLAKTAQENQSIIEDTPDNEFVRANAGYQVYQEFMQEIAPEKRPSLLNSMRGHFTMTVENVGQTLAQTLISFEVEKTQPDQGRGLEQQDNIVKQAQSLAGVPFLDLFADEISKETKKAKRLLDRSKQHTDIQLKTIFRKDANPHEVSGAIFAHQDKDHGNLEVPMPTGIDALYKGLESSILAKDEFYDLLWLHLNELYEGAIRDVAEDQALGRSFIHANLKPSSFRDERGLSPWRVRAHKQDDEGNPSSEPENDGPKPA